MPVYTRETLKSSKLPWVDIDDFKFINLGRLTGTAPAKNQNPDHKDVWGHAPRDLPSYTIECNYPKERLICLVGTVQVEWEGGKVSLNRMEWVDLPASGGKVSNIAYGSAEVLQLSGHWKEAIRTSIFQFRPDKPCDYHYHDGDEYWFVFRGNFTLNYDDREFKMQPGMMLAAPMGFEHGALHPEQHFEGVGFATQLEGRLRDGHLTRDLHGAPVKNRDVPENAYQP